MHRRRFEKSATLVCIATQAANGLLYSLRWAPDTPINAIFELEYLKMQFIQTVAATATIFPRYEAHIARNMVVSDSSGLALSLAGNDSKQRTDQESSLVTDLRITNSAAAGLTAGTPAKTEDTQPILELQTNLTITTPNSFVYATERNYLQEGNVQQLKKHEGIVIKGPTTIFGAAGQGDLNIVIGWAESY